MHDSDTGSRTWLMFMGFSVIAAFFLFTEHRAHLFGWLPFLFLLACPFLHMFGHGGHWAHGKQPEDGDRSAPPGFRDGDHQHSLGAPRDNSRSEP